jgi:ATP-dependent RNA helicase DDX42
LNDCPFVRYFDEDDEHVTPASTLEYIPAPGSPSYQPQGGQSSDSEEDPLDAFMAGIEREVQRETDAIQEKEDKKKGIRDDIEEEDVEESYYR